MVSKLVFNLNLLEMVGISSKHTLRWVIFIRASNKNNELPRILKHFQVFFRSESKVLATKPVQPTSSPLPPQKKHLIDKEMNITDTMQRLFRFATNLDAKGKSEPKIFYQMVGFWWWFDGESVNPLVKSVNSAASQRMDGNPSSKKTGFGYKWHFSSTGVRFFI